MTTPRRALTRRQPLLRRFHAHALLAPLALLFLAAVCPVQAQDGTLDPTFGTGGLVTSGAAAGANATAIDSADRIVVAGGLGGNFSVARFTTAGVLDPTFGTGGSVTTDFGGSDVAKAVVLQSDGRIVVAGSSNGNFALARYTADGVLDATFGTGGLVTTDFGGDDFANAVALQPGGLIVAAGGINFDNFALARYTTDGVLDPTFGSGGRVTTDFFGRSDRANAMATYPDGRIIVVGTSEAGGFSTAEFALARYTPDGTLDPTFNGGGLVMLNYEWDDELYAVAIDSEQRIVFGGTAFINLAASSNGRGGFNDVNVLVVGRMETGGALIGYSEAFAFDSYLGANSIAIQADDKVLATGVVFGPGVHDFILVRLNRDGSYDDTFDGGGRVQTDFGGSDTAYAMDLDSAGRIVVAGASSGNVAVARYLNTPPLSPPVAAVSPGALSVTLAPDATTTETVTISNTAVPGAEDLSWLAVLTNFDAGRSACTPGQTLVVTVDNVSPFYTFAGAQEVGQSFTATCTGLLTTISPTTVANQDGFWSGNLRLYDGAGTTGIELAAVGVSGFSQAGVSGSFTATFPTPIGVTEGQAYTWFMDLDVGPSGHPSISGAYTGGDAYVSLDGNPSSAVDYDADVPFTASFEPGSSWVAISPTSGTVAPGSSGTLDVTFDATGLADGTYTADLVITTNDPENPRVTVPLTLTVGAPVTAPACGPDASALLLTDFATADGAEFFDLTNAGPVPLDLADCVALTYDVFTGYAAATFNVSAVTLAPAEVLRIGNTGVPGVDLVAPTGFLPEPWGFGLVRGDLVAGDVAYNLGDAILTSLIYLAEDAVYLFYHEDPALDALYCGLYEGRIAPSSPEVCPPSVAARRGGGVAAFLTEARALQASLGRTADEAATASSLPSAYALGAAYPNPASGRATLGYDLPEASAVRLAVYDALGRAVAVLVDGEVEAGRHEASLAAGSLAAGVYLVRLTAGPFAATQRVTVVR